MLLDASLVLYIGLLVLAVWRCLLTWRCCGVWLEYANYCVLLYALLLVLLVYAIYEFVTNLHDPLGRLTLHHLPGWLRPVVIGAPIATSLSCIICGVLTWQHIGELRKASSSSARDSAALKHDRAVQIITLPGLYSVMAMSSLMRIFQCLIQESHTMRLSYDALANGGTPNQYIVAKSENCFWVGDLYESWALYQFGKLTLELIQSAISKLRCSPVKEVRESADALLNSHKAVESLAWLGIGLFLIVCSFQAGWSLYLLAVNSNTQMGGHEWTVYNTRMAQFSAAGMVASMGAIYNVHVVQVTFHTYLERYSPLLKFITVKIIVTFAFFQKGFIWCLRAFQQTLPGMTRKVVRKVPLLGDILAFSEVEFSLFYASLITFECLAIASMYIWAWSAYEEWYNDEDPVVGKAGDEEDTISDAERQPLLGGQDPNAEKDNARSQSIASLAAETEGAAGTPPSGDASAGPPARPTPSGSYGSSGGGM